MKYICFMHIFYQGQQGRTKHFPFAAVTFKDQMMSYTHIHTKYHKPRERREQMNTFPCLEDFSLFSLPDSRQS